MGWITTISHQALVDGQPSSSFSPKRGIC